MGFKDLLKNLLKSNIPKSLLSEIRQPLLDEIEKLKENAIGRNAFVNISFSQEGEDLILNRLMEHKKDGFYIDVGAHHPMRFSNTYKFYLRGWRGVNIDALPGCMKLFDELRPRDLNIETPILNDDSKTVTYYMFDESALNTFDQKTAEKVLRESPQYKLINTINLKPKKLENVLSELKLDSQEIDFLSIDVEGVDIDILKSNNWQKFKPQYILIESIATNLIDDLDSDIYRFLVNLGYSLKNKTVNTLIFELNSSDF
jgi:FkbM family methyltransferase